MQNSSVAAAATAMCWFWAFLFLRAAADEISVVAMTGLPTLPGNGVWSLPMSETTKAVTPSTQLEVSDAILLPDEESTPPNRGPLLSPVDDSDDSAIHRSAPTDNDTSIGGVEYAGNQALRAIRICYLASDKTTKYVKQKQGRIVSGAMSYAVERVNSDPHLLLKYGLRLEFVYVDDSADSMYATAKMSEHWRDTDVVAFFGPENTCDVEGRLAAAWNLPIFAYVSIMIAMQRSHRLAARCNDCHDTKMVHNSNRYRFAGVNS